MQHDNIYHDPSILAGRLDELADMTERVSRIIKNGLAEWDRHEIERSIRAAGALRTALLDVMQTNRHSDKHPYGRAMLRTDGSEVL